MISFFTFYLPLSLNSLEAAWIATLKSVQSMRLGILFAMQFTICPISSSSSVLNLNASRYVRHDFHLVGSRFPSRPELSSVELEQLPLLLRKLDAHRSVFNRLKLAIEFKCELIRPQSGEYGLGYCFRKVNKQLDATADRNLCSGHLEMAERKQLLKMAR